MTVPAFSRRSRSVFASLGFFASDPGPQVSRPATKTMPHFVKFMVKLLRGPGFVSRFSLSSGLMPSELVVPRSKGNLASRLALDLAIGLNFSHIEQSSGGKQAMRIEIQGM